MALSTKQMGVVSTAVYVIMCICTLGSLWVIKIVIQKAIIDALE